MEVLETTEKIHEAGEHAEHGAHGKGGDSRRIAVLIGVLAVLLAILDIGGKGAQNSSLAANIEAANLWAFFQAKSIRMTVVRTAAAELEALQPENLAPEKAAAFAKAVSDWRAEAARYDSEPATGEGRKELAPRAKEKEAVRDRSLAAYHIFEYGAAALQIAIVLASSSIVTGARALVWLSVALGGAGVVSGILGWFFPLILHH